MLSAAMRRADVNQAAVNAAVASDMAAPGLPPVAQLCEPASEDGVLGQAGEFGIERRDGFKQFVVNDRLFCLLGALLRNPTTRFKQRADLPV
jgi:hypothetical protein